MGKSVRRQTRKRRGICRESALRRFVGGARAPRENPWYRNGKKKGDALSTFVMVAFQNGIDIDGVTLIPQGTIVSELELTGHVDSGMVGRWVEERHASRVEKTEVVALGWDNKPVDVTPILDKVGKSENNAKRTGDKLRSDLADIALRNVGNCRKIFRQTDMLKIAEEMIASGNILTADEIQAEIDKRFSERFREESQREARMRRHNKLMERQARKKGR